MTAPKTNESYADRVLREVSVFANGGLDPDAIEKAIQDASGALQKQMAALRAADYSTSEHKTTCPKCAHPYRVTLPVPNTTEVARATAHTTKAVDELYRLMSFAAGQPDSRPDMGSLHRDLLSLLTLEQMSTLDGWLMVAQGRS
jgi:hypothetical protein